jgi:hypothetical protein
MIKQSSSTNTILEQLLSGGLVLLFLYFVGTLSNKYTSLNGLESSITGKANPDLTKKEPKFVPASSDEEEFFKSMATISNDKLALRETAPVAADIRQWYQKKANALQKTIEARKEDLTEEQLTSTQATVAYYRELEYLNCAECKLGNKE